MVTSWTKEVALAELRALANQTKPLAKKRRFSEEHVRWVARSLAFLEEVFGQDSRYYQTFASFTWLQSVTFVMDGPADPEATWNPGAAIEKRHQKAYEEQLESARGLLLAAADFLDRTDLETVYKGKDTAPESSAIVKVLNLSEHKLGKVVRAKPSNEKEIQEAFENLLIGADLTYSRETESIEYSSKTYTPDFTMQKLDLAIEIKLCNRGGREKENNS